MENILAVNAPPFSFEVIPLPGKYLDRTRTLHLDAQNNQTIERLAKGGEPLRDQLRRAAPGEEIILASFSPFRVQGPYKEFGPIFIAREARPWIGTKVPVFGQDGYFQAPVVLRAYDVNEAICAAVATPPDLIETTVRHFFQDQSISFVDARFALYGCFGCRFQRTGESPVSEPC